MQYSGKYEVISQIGHGSMGMVYKVRHTMLDTILALKVLPPHLTQNADLVKRFYREARVMARLNHPNVARVIDVQRDEDLGVHYFVMEYIQGQTLKKFAQDRGPLSVLDVVRVAREVARALDYAHKFEPPVIHRDIKPTNIMVEDRTNRVVVMDFGIAKELDESEQTRAGTILGTLKYCPPEQMRHEPIDGSADIYALGMLMYEIHTGTHLFAGLNETQVIRTVLEPTEYQPDFPATTLPSFADTVRKAIAKDRAKRYRYTEDLLRDLDACWRSLDESQPTLIATVAPSHMPAEGLSDDLAHIEEQIKKLEEERERRLVTKLQAQARQGREMAAQVGAAQLAGDLFRRACGEEESASALVQARKYSLAEAAYAQASTLFAEAREAAILQGMMRSATQARDEMAEARREADRYGAGERAGTSYGQALALQAQADDFWQHQSYREASELYGEARSLFEDAQERAYCALLEEETKIVQGKVKAAQEAAVRDQADSLASERFWEAVRTERRADVALGQQEFGQAQELYRVAVRQFEDALQQTKDERQRRETLARHEQAQVQAARQRAEAGGALPGAEHYQRAIEVEQRADALLESGDFLQAVETYRQAAERFDQAQKAAERAQEIERLRVARERAEELRAEARALPTPKSLASRLRQITQSTGEARRLEQRDELAKATVVYGEVAQAWSQFIAEAVLDGKREKAERAHAQLLEHKRPRDALRAWAKGAWDAADESLSNVETALQGREYDRVVELCEGAVRAYGVAREQAEAERRSHERAKEAKQRAVAAQKNARLVGGPTHAKHSYEQGSKALDEGEKALESRHWNEAEERFDAALSCLEVCSKEAQQTKARQVAEVARDEATLANREAQAVRAEELVPEKYAQAMSLLREAEETLAQPDDDNTVQVFGDVAALFRTVRLEAVIKRAEGARARVETLQQLAAAQRYPGRLVKPARNAFGRADRLFRKARYHEAYEQYMEAGSRFSELLKTPASKSTGAESGRRIWGPRARYSALSIILLSLGGVLYYKNFHDKTLGEQRTGVVPETAAELTADRAPVFGSWSPSESDISVPEGQSQNFSVTAKSPTDLPLRYEWYLNGEKKAEGEGWAFGPRQAQEDGKPDELKIIVTDQDGRVVSRTWQVRTLTANRPPSIDEASPGAPLVELSLGDELTFSVRASDPDPDDQLQYRWFENGNEVSQEPQWHHRAALPGKSYTVSVEVIDLGGLTAKRSWDVRVPTAEVVPVPPVITRATPDVTNEQTLPVNEGESLAFSLEAESPNGHALRYDWYLDGEKKAGGKQWVYQAGRRDGATRPKEVKVVVTDTEGQRSERLWRVLVRHLSRPPQIVRSSPRDGEVIRLRPGESRDFSAEARGPDERKTLSYLWTLDGKDVAKLSKGRFRAPATGGKHTLALTVANASGLKATQTWSVIVEAPPVAPEIVTVRPTSSTFTAEAGQPLSFAVNARIPGHTDRAWTALRYEWTVDGGAPQVTERAEFAYANAPIGKHKLRVAAVTPQGLTSKSHTWIFEVIAKPPPERVSRAAPEDLAINESEVRVWLESYRRAWQDKDVEALVSFGEVSRANATRLRQVLVGYKSFRVSLEAVDIRIDGGEAKVTFNRIDTIDGKTLKQPDRKVMVLVKGPNGRVARRLQ